MAQGVSKAFSDAHHITCGMVQTAGKRRNLKPNGVGRCALVNKPTRRIWQTGFRKCAIFVTTCMLAAVACSTNTHFTRNLHDLRAGPRIAHIMSNDGEYPCF